MKSTRKFEFHYQKQKWTIERSRHLYDNRGPSDFSRDEFLDRNRYVEIFKSALRNGITSFREKGAVVINVPDENSRHWSVLCKLDSNNKFFIITVYRVTTGRWWKSFIKVQNRINIMYDYVVTRMTKDERRAKEMDKVFHEVEVELKNDVNYMMNAFNDVERCFN